jgi:hypothetical protein
MRTGVQGWEEKPTNGVGKVVGRLGEHAGVWTEDEHMHEFLRKIAHAPLLVTVNEPRRDCANVRAGTDEQEDDE